MSTLLAYNRRIDGLRAVAVLLVVLHHWLPSSSWINWTPNGQLGVDLFFVLSGYLITGILLRFRRVVESGAKSAARALGNFYARRALRLFPLYYAMLALTAIWPATVSGVSLRQSWPWYVTFLQNYKLFFDRAWDGFLSPFWSLAVEEQYYLLWGVAVLALPRRLLPSLIAGGIATAWLVRLAGVLLSGTDVVAMSFWNILTPACFDALGIGSLAALVAQDQGAASERLGRWSRHLAIPSVLFIAAYRVAPAVWYVGGRTAVALIALRLLYWATSAEPAPWLGRLLETGPVVELGKRSYGLYVFHDAVPFLWHSAGSVLRTRLPGWPGWAELAFADDWNRLAWVALLLVLAFGSWRFFEGPINGLKDRFAP